MSKMLMPRWKATMRAAHWHVAAAMLWALAGCAAPQPVNPSFAVTVSQARSVLQECRDKPVRLDRPLVVVGGYLDPGIAPAALARMFGEVSGDRRIVAVPLGAAQTFDACRRDIVEAVERAFPSSDPVYTTRVDVVGFSMGGIAARYAARHDPVSPTGLKRLDIARLFTISSPHQGATVADIHLVVSRLQLDMRPGSAFIARLNSRVDPLEPQYPVYAYVRLNDRVVGVEHAAPPGQTPWWIGGLPHSSAHSVAYRDPRVVADIALRLRDAPPLTTDPAAPLPVAAIPGPISTPLHLTIQRVP